ncbi:DUF4166 domain-containing protein [Couchioplanes azureus]|uniref:DUF4166 domain-containing protein n=1 Tax=Couchioplanes caeruleus TaxID=56438 RepID=UPI0016704FB7|nr:DUF4166 domain-containing protein [Couchioplanes caeruleus]GGQ72564.1 hypothetical protein GCM10010166_48150 [Couchioplanes caeruleus subsp. azureus]
MNSIFERALGDDFGLLHPRLQDRFGVTAGARRGCVGTGVMDRIWRGPAYVKPFLHLGTARHVLFPETGTAVPFTIENYAYTDSYGRPTLTFVRTFEVGGARRRRFDATMVWSEKRQVLVDFLGTHQHIAVDLHLSVDAAGGLHIRSGTQRFRGGVRCPRPLSGDARLHEWYDDATGRFRIEVAVENRHFGPIFGYSGSFTTRYVDDTAPVPAAVRPLRENPRE